MSEGFQKYREFLSRSIQNRISKHFTMYEVAFSNSAIKNGIDNTPTESIITNATKAAKECFDVCRSIIGPMKIDSWYRSPVLNTTIGGSRTSDHPRGNAIDVWQPNETVARNNYMLLRDAIEDGKLIVDQLILERKGKDWWLHIGYRGSNSRKQCFEKC